MGDYIYNSITRAIVLSTLKLLDTRTSFRETAYFTLRAIVFVKSANFHRLWGNHSSICGFQGSYYFFMYDLNEVTDLLEMGKSVQCRRLPCSNVLSSTSSSLNQKKKKKRPFEIKCLILSYIYHARLNQSSHSISSLTEIF